MPTGYGPSVTYTGGIQPPSRSRTVRSGDMRSRSSIAAFARLCGATGLGVYLGGAVAGLIAVAGGQAVGGGWPSMIPALAIVGLGVGAIVAWLTRRWLLPQLPGRWWLFAIAGLVTLPLFTAVSQLHALDSLGVALIVLGGVAMTLVYLRAPRVTREVHSGARSR